MQYLISQFDPIAFNPITLVSIIPMLKVIIIMVIMIIIIGLILVDCRMLKIFLEFFKIMTSVQKKKNLLQRDLMLSFMYIMQTIYL